jgi:hypothetical protein
MQQAGVLENLIRRKDEMGLRRWRGGHLSGSHASEQLECHKWREVDEVHRNRYGRRRLTHTIHTDNPITLAAMRLWLCRE